MQPSPGLGGPIHRGIYKRRAAPRLFLPISLTDDLLRGSGSNTRRRKLRKSTTNWFVESFIHRHDLPNPRGYVNASAFYPSYGYSRGVALALFVGGWFIELILRCSSQSEFREFVASRDRSLRDNSFA